MTINPLEPVTVWVLVTFVATCLIVGVPLLTGLLSYKRLSKEGQERDIAIVVGPIIAAALKMHNDEIYAHPAALGRYTTLDTFNGALRELRTEIGALRTVLDINETQRRQDAQSFREDLRDLKVSVARATGRHDDDNA